MPYFIARRGTSPAMLQQRYGSARIIDVTSRSSEPWVHFSPFYPHGNIPVPLSPGYVGESVEGIWQGLKVFEKMPSFTRRVNQVLSGRRLAWINQGQLLLAEAFPARI